MASIVKVLKNASQFRIATFGMLVNFGLLPVRAEIPKCSDTHVRK